MYLTDTNKENGCLRIAKGTHNLPKLLPHTSSKLYDGIKWIPDNVINQYEIIDLIQTGPYAVFFNINIAHGCYTNTTDNNRYSLAWEYLSSKNTNVKDIDHRYTATDMAREGKEVEKSVLTHALKLVFNDRVFIYGNRTVVL